jgi:hypothetical protein
MTPATAPLLASPDTDMRIDAAGEELLLPLFFALLMAICLGPSSSAGGHPHDRTCPSLGHR